VKIAGNAIFADDVYVDTINLEGNAVTVPAVGQFRGNFNAPTWTTVADATITLDADGWVYVITTASIFYDGGPAETFCRLVIGATVLATQGGGLGYYKAVSMAGAVHLTKGTHTGYIQHKSSNTNSNLSEANVFIMGVKR